ncbi:MAG TPA: CRTAC1 family protein [Vicinamibacterales bacterium]|nr:CRTAC1 family protein [Vicinamibacterales bacterium]
MFRFVAPLAAVAVLAVAHPAAVPLTFENVAVQAGLASFHEVGGGTAEKRYIPEVMSGGVCAADFDGDGWTDVILVNGGTFASAAGRAPAPPHGIFRNTGAGHFENVTARTGIRNAGWGMGCAAADYDNDGDPDLLITNFLAPNQLWRNDGGWKFADVTAAAGVGGAAGRWNTGATFGDYDGDGRLDLFVNGYVHLDPAHLPQPEKIPDCRHRGLVVNCGPRGLPGERDLLFHNEGGGRFRDVSAGVDPKAYYGLGAVFLPLAGDGGMRLYVGNDSTPNALYRFDGGRPVDTAMQDGLALSEEGHEQAGMGIAWGDYDRDSRPDIYVTNFVDDYNTLYRNLGGGLFEDVTRRAGLAQPTWLYMGWGTAFADFDRDGRDDLIVANGHVYPQVDTLGIPSRWRMPVQAFVNRGDGGFTELPRQALPGLAVGRGLAAADFWNDGRLGVVVNNLDGTPALYRAVDPHGHYVELTLEGATVRDATGTRVMARWPGGQALRIVASGGSYLSSHDPRVNIGVGDASEVRCEIRWPDGRVQQLPSIRTDRHYRVRQGGAPVPVGS